jgi:hypothetical protein
MHQPHNGFAGGRPAGTIPAQQRDNLARTYTEVYAL